MVVFPVSVLPAMMVNFSPKSIEERFPSPIGSCDFILAGITTKELLNATDMAIEMKQKGVLGKPCPDYVDENVSMKVVRIIQGYVNVVNKMVWRKD